MKKQTDEPQWLWWQELKSSRASRTFFYTKKSKTNLILKIWNLSHKDSRTIKLIDNGVIRNNCQYKVVVRLQIKHLAISINFIILDLLFCPDTRIATNSAWSLWFDSCLPCVNKAWLRLTSLSLIFYHIGPLQHLLTNYWTL